MRMLTHPSELAGLENDTLDIMGVYYEFSIILFGAYC